jgi:transcriptional regulator with XRE-family HTH domain
MNHAHIATYLRSYRKRSGLSLKELAFLLGYPNEGPVSLHERLRCMPPFRAALGYEAVFRIPASRLFPAAFDEISRAVEGRLKMLEKQLQNPNVKGRKPVLIARKLEWMRERQNLEQPDFPDEAGLS